MKRTQTRASSPAAGRQPTGTKIDWADVRRRLESVVGALDRGWTPTPEEARRILRSRAAALAREAEPACGSGERVEILKFLLAHERYGVETRLVTEVYPLKEFTVLPGTPPFVLGAVNVRGKILTVVDIKKFFGLPDHGLTDLNKVILLRARRTVLGVVADAILGLETLLLADLEPSLPTLTGIRAEFLRGVTRDRLAVLDVEKIVSDKGMILPEGEG